MTALVTLSECTPVNYVLLPLGLSKKVVRQNVLFSTFALLLFVPHIFCNNTNKPFLILPTNKSLTEFPRVILSKWCSTSP